MKKSKTTRLARDYLAAVEKVFLALERAKKLRDALQLDAIRREKAKRGNQHPE